MNSKQKVVVLIGIAVTFAAFAVWILSGREMLSHYAPVIDPKNKIFGKPDEEVFIWGLDLTLLVSGMVLLICGYIFSKLNKKQKSNSQN